MARLNRKSKIQQILFYLFLCFFILRYPNGRDLPNYIYYLTEGPRELLFGSGRFFFIDFYYSLSRTLTTNPTYFLFITNLICVGLFGYTVNKYSLNKSLSCFLFITYGYAQVYLNSGIRQALTMAVFFFAFYKYLLKDKYLAYILLILLASTYHDSVLVMLIFVPIRYFLNCITDKNIVISMLLSALVGIIVMPLIIPHMQFIGWYYEYLSVYRISILGIGQQLLQFIIVAYLYFGIKSPSKNDRFIFIVNCLSFIIYLLFVGYSLISRVCDFIQIINLIYLPCLLMQSNVKYKKAIVIIIVLMNLFLLVSDLYVSLEPMNSSLNLSLLNYPYQVFGLNNYLDILKIYVN